MSLKDTGPHTAEDAKPLKPQIEIGLDDLEKVIGVTSPVIKGIIRQAFRIHLKKTHDYCGPDPATGIRDVLATFRGTKDAGIDELGQIVVYLTTKMKRMQNVYKHGAKVEDEALRDTLLDILNYAAFGVAALDELKEKQNA